MKRLFILALAMMPATAVAQQELGSASVHIYRLNPFLARTVRPDVYMDGIKMASIASGSFFDIQIPAGKHFLYIGNHHAGEHQEPTALVLEPGHEYYLSTAYFPTGIFYRFETQMVAPDQGRSDMAELKPLNAKHIKRTSLP
jgi:hypothetical protein